MDELSRGLARFWHLLVLYARSGNEAPTELGLTGTLLALGLFLAEPFNWWHTFDVAAAYRGLALVAGEQVWGLILIAIAVLSAVGMTADADGGPVHRLHQVTAYTQLFWWVAFALSIILTNVASTGWVTFGCLGLGQLWVCHRLAVRR